MRWFVELGLRLQKIIVALAIGVVALGVVQLTKTPVDLLPEYQPPTVEVQTEALGLSASEVEQLITVPLEQDLLVGVAFVDEIRSVSLPGLSSVVMTFEPGTDLLDARQVVQERLTQAVGVAGLPAVAKPPQMIQPLSSHSRVAMVKLTSEQLSPIDMSVLARWVMAPRLLGVSGVANVAIWGNRERQLQVLVDPERLRADGVTLADVVRTTGNALEVSPLSYLEASKPGTGGFIDTPNQRLNIFHEQAISSPTELAQVPVESSDGRTIAGSDGPLVLGDVTDVVVDHQPLIGDTACSGDADCLILVVEKFPGANAGRVADDVDAALAALRPGLGDMQVDSSIYRPASHTESAFSSLGWALLAGAVLVLAVLLVLLRGWRRTTVVVTGLAVSLAAAVVVLNLTGATVNLIVLLGLLVGLTALIDDAVSDTVGTAERIRQLRRSGTTAPVWPTLVESTVALRRSALFAALVLGAATLPLLFLRDAGAAFVPPIVASYLSAVAISFVVALLVTPGLAMLLLSSPAHQEGPSRAVRSLHRHFDNAAPRIVARTRPAYALVAVAALAGFVAAPFLDLSMRPSLEERDVLVELEAAPGTSLPRMSEITSQAVEDLGAVPGVVAANAHIGRAVMSDKDVDVNQGEVWVALDRDADYDRTLQTIKGTVADYAGVTARVMTYTEQRLEDVIPPDGDDITVRAYGDDPEVLAEKAEEIRSAVEGVEGATGVAVEPIPEESVLEVQVDLGRAQALGVKPGDVRRAAAMLIGGITVGNLFEEQKVFDVVVWGAPQIRQSMEGIQNLLINTPSGDVIRLGEVADVRETPNPATIRHEGVARYVQVTGNVDGRSVADVNADIEKAVGAIAFPLDHHAEVLGDHSEQRQATIQLLSVALAALLLVYLLFQSTFHSWRLATLALLVLPVSLVGGLVGTLFTGGTVTLGVMAGMLAVLGIAARLVTSSIDQLLYLQRREHVSWGASLVLAGTRARLLPVLTTVLVTTAVMLPLAVVGGRAGLEMIGPAAITVLGGLVTTTLVTLFVVPVLALRMGSDSERESWVEELLEPAGPAPELAQR
jgi:Cu/Ag efflux pump CusA